MLKIISNQDLPLLRRPGGASWILVKDVELARNGRGLTLNEVKGQVWIVGETGSTDGDVGQFSQGLAKESGFASTSNSVNHNSFPKTPWLVGLGEAEVREKSNESSVHSNSREKL